MPDVNAPDTGDGMLGGDESYGWCEGVSLTDVAGDPNAVVPITDGFEIYASQLDFGAGTPHLSRETLAAYHEHYGSEDEYFDRRNDDD